MANNQGSNPMPATTQAAAQKRPIVYWGMHTVALHYMAQGDRVTKSNLMLELPRSDENTALLVAMSNAGRAVLGFQAQAI